jgi:hypothetical protein
VCLHEYVCGRPYLREQHRLQPLQERAPTRLRDQYFCHLAHRYVLDGSLGEHALGSRSWSWWYVLVDDTLRVGGIELMDFLSSFSQW